LLEFYFKERRSHDEKCNHPEWNQPSMTYKSIFVTRRGGPEVLQIVENPLRSPHAREVRVRTLAASVSLPEIEARYGRSPFPPKIPFTPGYAIVGEIEALGAGVTQFKAGDRVAALTVYGGYSEIVYWPARKLIPVPVGLDAAQIVPLILNYVVAYQTMHRVAKVKAGQTALIIGASGGIGTALLQLGKLAGLKMYGLASKHKHAALVEYGAIPIDYKTQDFVQVMRLLETGGLDVVFDGMGGEYLGRGFNLLQRSGQWVSYANPFSRVGLFQLLGKLLWYNLPHTGRKIRLYGTGASFLNMHPFQQDWAVLFKLLDEGKIAPVIAAKFPLLEAAKANTLLESGQVTGNVVLLAEELLDIGLT
jgi:NADPH:quinone reductase-like Zn-dependent oxidoreductase